MTTDEPVLKHLAEQGISRTLDGAQTLLLDTDANAWLVTEGSVELYVLPSANDSAAAGALRGGRRFLLGVGNGQMIYPAAAAASAAGLRLVALGQKAKLVSLPLEQLHRFFREAAQAKAAATLIEQWCYALASGLELAVPADRFQALRPGVTCGLRKEEIAYPQSGFCWATLTAGAACFLSQDALGIGTGETLPMTSHLWLQATEPDTSIQPQTTLECLQTGEVEAGLAAFQTIMLACASRQWHTAATGEQTRLREKTEHEQQRLRRSLASLASVSAKPAQGSAYAGISTGSSLLAACELIGRVMGTQFVAPPPAQPGRQTRDPVAAIAEASRVRHRHVALRSDWWRHDNGPLLAFMEADGRPLALLPSRSGGAIRYDCYDTQQRQQQALTPALAAQLKPMAYSFLAPLPGVKLTPRLIWQFASHGLQRDTQVILLCGLMAGVLGLLAPILSAQLFDEVIPLAERSRLAGFTFLLVLFAGVAAAFEMTRGMALLRMEVLLETRLEAGMMDRLLRLPTAFFKNYQTGDLAMRVLGISMIRRLLTASVLGALMTGIFSSVNLALLFYYDAKLAVLGLGVAALAGVVIYWRGRQVLHYTRAMTAQEGKVAGLLFQFMNGIAKLRVAGAEKRAFSVWAEQFAVQKRLAYESGAVQNHFETFNAAYPVLASMLFFGAVYLITERLSTPGAAQAAALIGVEALSTGQFIAVVTAFSQFLTGFLAMGLAAMGALQAVALYERAQPIFEALPEVNEDSSDPGTLSGEIELSHVSFRYSESTPLILNDLSLHVARGQMVAIVGPSGSGKSTLFRLLLGLEQTSTGAVLYDGQSLATLDVEAVRRQIGVVLQKDRVQPGDVFHNIVGQSSNLTVTDAWEAARAAGLEDDINAMPMGMHTNVNDGGSTFSGGQRQRLLIARAIVHKPRILLFDEATSALDNRTQKVVSDSLAQLRVTRVVIAHRLSTIQHADRIYVLDQGRVVESGNYAELSQRDGLFAQLIRRQLN